MLFALLQCPDIEYILSEKIHFISVILISTPFNYKIVSIFSLMLKKNSVKFYPLIFGLIPKHIFTFDLYRLFFPPFINFLY